MCCAIGMSFVLFGMIFNTAVSIFYAFIAGFFEMNTKTSNIAIIIIGIIATNFAGFTGLVSFFYPLIGNLGLFLIAVLIYSPIKLARDERKRIKVVRKA